MSSPKVGRYLTAVAAGTLLGPTAASPQSPAPSPQVAWTSFIRTFDAALDSDRVVGAAVVLVKDGRIVAHHEVGSADRARAQAVNERTIFHYGSITKTLTAIAIMQLRDRGKLSLDDKITRYVPELRAVHDPYGMIDSITLRMLLSHSAGFQNPTWPYEKGQGFEPFEPTTWAQLVAMMPYQTLHFKPGSQYGYSNPGFIYLARVIEQLSGDPWEVYIQKNIFSPLDLTHSYFGATPYYLAADRSNNYTVEKAKGRNGRDTIVENGRDFNPGITIPNGGWNAPLSDLATYMAFLQNATHGSPELRIRYDAVLKRSTLEEMWRPVIATTQGPNPKEWVGISFFSYDRGGTKLVGHTGSQAGFLSFMYLNPTTSTGIIAAFNTTDETHASGHSGFGAASRAAMELISRD